VGPSARLLLSSSTLRSGLGEIRTPSWREPDSNRRFRSLRKGVARLLPAGPISWRRVIKHRSSREMTMVGRGPLLQGRLFHGGTEGSNPPSSGESGTNLISGRIPSMTVRGLAGAPPGAESVPISRKLLGVNRRARGQPHHLHRPAIIVNKSPFGQSPAMLKFCVWKNRVCT
jgi:hypothetical protein